MKPVCLFLLCLCWGSLSGGVVFEVETKDHKKSETTMTHISASGNNLKLNLAEDKGGKGNKDGEMIFRGDLKQMLILQHQQKAYFVMDQAAMAGVSSQINDAMAKAREAMKNLPEEQRAMMEKMMKDRMPSQAVQGPTSKLVKQGEKKTLNGYPCVRYDVMQDGRKIREHWVTPWARVEGAEEVAGTLKQMAEFFKGMLSSISKIGGGQGPMHGSDNMFQHLDEMDGFPVVSREFAEDGSLESESALRSAKKQTLDPADFEVPAGYKRQSFGR